MNSILEESTVYQDIIKKGMQRGAQSIALLCLKSNLGKVTVAQRRKIESLSLEKAEQLCLALLYFQTTSDLTVWLKQHTAKTWLSFPGV